MQIDKQIRGKLRDRVKAIKRTGLSKKSVLIFILLIVLCCLNPPGTFSFFTDRKTLQSTLKVTNENKHIPASLIFKEQKSRISSSHKPGSINAVLSFGRAYDTKNVDIYSLNAYSEAHSLRIDNVSFSEEGLLLSFNCESISQLGHGNHTVHLEGMFKDGWIKFSADGILEIIDEDVVAEQEAIKLVEDLEADSTTWHHAKIDAARKAVESLRECAVKNDLLRRMQNIQERLIRIINEMNKKKLFEEAENALSLAEKTRSKADYGAARELIVKLPEGEQKESMVKRLKAIETIDDGNDDENSGKPSVIEDVYKPAEDVAEMQEEISKLLQESEPAVFMYEKNNEKVSE